MNIVQWIMIIIAGGLGLSMVMPYIKNALENMQPEKKDEDEWIDDMVIDIHENNKKGGLLEIVACWEHLTDLLHENKLYAAEQRMVQIFPLLVVKEDEEVDDDK